MATTHTHGIWVNDAYDPMLFSLSQTPVEKVSYGGYTLCLTGTKKEMARQLRLFKKKPCLIEKYMKIHD